MQLIGAYPITEAMVAPYIGQPVIAVSQNGDRIMGIIQSCQAGQIYLTPYNPAVAPTAATVQGLNKKVSKHPKVKNLMTSNKANISLWGYGWGLGAGTGITLALLTLAALFTVPFWI